MYRAAAFRKDLEYFFGTNWEQELERRSRFPAVQRYLDHLETLANSQPVLLIAHSYTQHLAITSGGQIIAKLVCKGLGLPESGEGTASFKYTNGQPKQLSTIFKSKLDALEPQFTHEEVDALICEHQAVFGFNADIIRGYKVGVFSPFVAAIKLGAKSRIVIVATAIFAVASAVYVARKL